MSNISKILLVGVVILILGAVAFFYWNYKKNNSLSTPPSQATISPAKNQSQNMDPNGPYYHQIYSATSKDGLTWEEQNKMLFEHASVPGAVIKDRVIYLYFVDMAEASPQMSVGISKDLGKTFEKKKVEIKGIESVNAVDPHPELLENGEIRLYYFYSNVQNIDPAKAKNAHQFYSAASTDSINFTNPQLAYEDTSLITDPDVFKTTNDWRMFVSKGQSLDLLISADSGLKFTKQDDFIWDKGGVSDTFNFNGTYRTFYCGQGIQSATGADKGKLVSEDGTRLGEENKIVCDPSVIQLPDGTYLMFYKTQDI